MAQYRVLLPTEIETVPEETRCGAEESAFKIVQLECGVQWNLHTLVVFFRVPFQLDLTGPEWKLAGFEHGSEGAETLGEQAAPDQ